MVGELRFVIRFKEQTHHFSHQFVRPGRQAERPTFPILLWDVNTPDGLESVALVAHRINDASDLTQRHVVRGLRIRPRRHGPLVGVQTPVGQQIQLRVEQLSVQFSTRQAAPAALTEDT